MTAFEKLFPGAYNLGVGIELTASNENKTNLTHDVNWRVYIYTTNTNNNWTNPESETVVTATLDGDSIYSVTNANFNLGYKKGQVTFASGTKTVKHGSNGKKSVSFSVYMDPKFQPWNVSGTTLTGSFDLPDISVAPPPPTYSVSTISSYPTRVRVGERVTVSIKSGGSGYTHDLWVAGDGLSLSVGSRTGSGSITFNIPSGFNDKIGTKSSMSGIFMIFSYTDTGGKAGDNYKSITILPPLSPPTVTGSDISDANTYASKVFTSTNQFLSAFSNINATVNGAAGSSGATITQYEVVLKNSSGTTRMSGTSSSRTVNLGVPSFITSDSEVLDVFTRVRDSNGNWSSQVKQSSLIRVHAYAAPSGTGSVARTTGTSAKVSYNWSASSIKQGGSTEVNSVSIQVQSKPRGGSYKVDDTYNATAFSGSNSVTLSGYTTTQSYDFRLYIYDGVTGVYVNINALGTEAVPLDLSRGGAGVGKIHSDSGAHLQVGNKGIDSEGKITAQSGIDIIGNGGTVLSAQSIYSPSDGLLVDLDINTLTRMVVVEITGNGYTNGIPIHTILQGYHYSSIGNFGAVHQIDLGLEIGACSFMIHDNRLKVWIPTKSNYMSFIVKAYNPMTGTVYNPTLSKEAQPTSGITGSIAKATVIKSWDSKNHGSGSGLDADLLDGKHASDFWNSSNDGSGSGLDADLLDGKHASQFAGFSYTKSGIFEIYELGEMMIITGQKGTDTTVSEWTRDGSVTYPKAFAEFPRVSLTVTTFSTRDKATPYLFTNTKTGFDFSVWDSPVSSTRTVHFIAIGKV